MEVAKIEKALDIFFTFHDLEGRDSVYIESSSYDDRYFRWKKDTFKSGKKFTVIHNADRIVMFDTIKVKDRIGSNYEKIKSNNTNSLFGIHPDIVKDLIMKMNIEEFTEKDKLELERAIEIQTYNKNKRKEKYNDNHCICKVKVKKELINKIGKITKYCGTCNKLL